MQHVFGGDALIGDVVQVKQLRGNGHAATLKSGATALLFLETYSGEAASILGGDVGYFVRQGDEYVSVGNAAFTLGFAG